MAVFTTTPSFVFTEDIKFKTLISKSESGKEQRRSKWTTPKHTFSLKFNVLNESEANTIRDFYIARKGAFEAFTWTNPVDSVEYTVRFESDNLSMEAFTANKLRKIGFKFIEIT